MRSAYCAARVRSCIAATRVRLGLGPQHVEQLERLLLVPDVERGGRLVEEDDAGLLRQRTGDDGALLLASRERPQPALPEPEQVEALERAGRGLRSRSPSFASGPR